MKLNTMMKKNELIEYDPSISSPPNINPIPQLSIIQRHHRVGNGVITTHSKQYKDEKKSNESKPLKDISNDTIRQQKSKTMKSFQISYMIKILRDRGDTVHLDISRKRAKKSVIVRPKIIKVYDESKNEIFKLDKSNEDKKFDEKFKNEIEEMKLKGIDVSKKKKNTTKDVTNDIYNQMIQIMILIGIQVEFENKRNIAAKGVVKEKIKSFTFPDGKNVPIDIINTEGQIYYENYLQKEMIEEKEAMKKKK